MMGLLTVAYTAFRYFMVYKEWKWKAVGNLLGRFCLYSFLGIAISAVILLPVVMQVLGTGRMEAEYYISVLYSPGFYKELPLPLWDTPFQVYDHWCGRGVRMLLRCCLWPGRNIPGLKQACFFWCCCSAFLMRGMC